MNSEYISLVVAIISAFVAIVTLVTTVIIGIMQIKQSKRIDEQNQRIDRRDEQRREDVVYSDATKFILKYNSYSSSNHAAEIYLLPLCVIAYKYNPIYPYRRKMYREFCSLTEEVQNCILKRQNIDIISAKDDCFFKNMLAALKADINKNYPNDQDWYYDNGKYFNGTLLYHGRQKIITVKCNPDKYYTKSLKMMPNNLDKDEMDYENHIINLLVHEKSESPIDKLMYEDTNFGTPVNDDDILISYLECVIAKYVSYYSHLHENYKFENIGYSDDFQGTKYMEDLFLDALLNIYIYY